MKRGIMGVAVLIAVAAVLALGLVFIFSDNPNPTGYAGSPVGAITAFVPSTECPPVECSTSADCDGEDFEDGCCYGDDLGVCSEGLCTCVDPCGEADECQPGAEDGDLQCGGLVGGSPAAKPCQQTDPEGENGGCDCDMDGCTEGASCNTFGVSSHPFDNPCGPNGHCEITGGEDGTLFGQCVCGPKGCEFTDDDDKDACPDTIKCDEGAFCNNGAQCGGPGVGACVNKECDCDCVSWAPCQEDEDCGPDGECITGPDGAFECMCANGFGCSFDQCEPGVTPCSNSDDCFGGDCQTTDGLGICEECGVNCNIDCSGNGDCPETVTQADCDAVGEAFGGASCTVDNDCDCIVPSGVCNNGCVEVDGVFWCPD